MSYQCKIGHEHGSRSGQRACDVQTAESIRRRVDTKMERAGIIKDGRPAFHWKYTQARFTPPLVLRFNRTGVRLFIFARGVRNYRVSNTNG